MANDERTEQQRTADNNLDEAVRAIASAYGYTGLVSEFTLVIASVDASEDGETDTVGVYCPPTVANHHALGLLSAGRVQCEDSLRAAEGEA